MTNIKAIPTVYNGYKFRSRLEARWAVFFDKLGVQYRYETEGFNLDGVKYLPDFFLPTSKHYIEVKPYEPTEEEINKAGMLAAMSGNSVFMFCGDVWHDVQVKRFMAKDKPLLATKKYADLAMANGDYDIVLAIASYFDSNYWGNYLEEIIATEKNTETNFDTEPNTEHIRVAFVKQLTAYVTKDDWKIKSCNNCDKLAFCGPTFKCPMCKTNTLSDSTIKLTKAYTAARQAQFEFGAKP